MSTATHSLPDRARAWNVAMTAAPGDLDLRIPAGDVVGTIPAGLRGGRLLSNGPGWTHIGERLAHPFDGHGYVRSYAFDEDGGVSLRARFIRTRVFEDEQRAQRIVHRGFATNPSDRFWQNVGYGAPRNVANTTIVRWGDRLLAGWEGGPPHALDPVTLETRGPDSFGGLIEGQATLAHMHRDAARDRLILCSVAAGRHTGITFREVDADDQLVQTRQAQLPGMTFAHDFAFSDRWYVLGGNPLALKPWRFARSMVGAGTLLESVRVDTSKPGELVLLPRDAEGPVRRVRLPKPTFVVHFANAFERSDGALVVDACVFHDFDFGEEFGYSGPHRPLDPSLPEARGTQRLYRITIPDGAEEATWEALVPHGVDFPRIDADHEGRETRTLVGACRADTRFSDPFDSVIAIDLESAGRAHALWTAPRDVFVGEPVLARAGEGEPPHVIAILSDGLEDRTTLVVLRADALERGPVASVSLPLMPIAFHGDWEARP